MGPTRDELYGKQEGLMSSSRSPDTDKVTPLGILADDGVRKAFTEECDRQNEWKERVDAVVKENAKLRKRRP